MFCVAAIVPAAVVFWLTYRTTDANAQQANQAAVRAENKHFGLSVYERLQAAQAMLDNIAKDPAADPVAQPLLERFFFRTLRLHGDWRTTVPDPVVQALAGLPPAQLQVIRLQVLPAIGGQPSPIVLLGHGPNDTLMVGVLRPSFLWGRIEDLAIDGQICIDAGSQRLACVGEEAIQPGGASDLVLDEWTLFLKAQFGSDAWKLTAVKRASALQRSPLEFLVPVSIGLLCLVLLLSSMQIRRILVPLETLVARIRAISLANAPRFRAASDDELATLTQAFDEMELRIRTQLDTLRTLAEVDRLILERVPSSLVIDMVMARIGVVVDVLAVGVTLERVGADRGAAHYLRGRGAARAETGTDQALAGLLRDADAHARQGGRWDKAGVPGPGLARHGAEVAVNITLGHREGSRIHVALGCLGDTIPSDEALSEVRELGERIAVAVAVEEHEHLLVFQARHDPLTALPNRLAATEALSSAIARSRVSRLAFAAIFIDLDRFKAINDGLGHALGDSMLVQAGERIRQCVGAENFVARLGGDEFFVIVHELHDAAGSAHAVAAIRLAFSSPIVAGEIELVLGFSAGIALYPVHGTDPTQLVHNSDVAMYRAKKAGGGRTEYFDEAMNAAALTRVELENDLRGAIGNGELHVHYQPRIDSRTGRMVGAEALARWRHPVRGDVPPAIFIELAEECGLIEAVGSFVLHEACRQLGEWKRLGFDLPVIAVNVSSHQLRSGKLPEVVGNALALAGMRWDELEIEVTESLLVNDSGAAAAQLHAIREAGGSVAIDDFGTGYSSLAYLTRLPVDTLKIDRTFIANLAGDAASAAVIRSIIALAHTLGKKIVAEGVEHMAQVELLGTWGCHIVQGYVYYRPLTADAMALELGRQPVPNGEELRGCD